MKKLSVKTKITAWFAGIVIAVSLLSMAVMYIGTLKVTENATKETLIAAASAASECITLSGTQPVISDTIEEITGAQIIVLGRNGNIYCGSAAKELISLKMTDGAFGRITVNGYHFFVYDKLLRFSGSSENAVWIRTYASFTPAQLFSRSMLLYWLILIPVLAAAAIGLSRLFTKRAFRPIDKINAAANEITESRDFSRRIPADSESQDEFNRTAVNFNRVLSRLEESYESEKQFTSDASHELRTPLAVIMAQSEILSEQLPAEAPEHKAAGTILRQSRQMSKLISELLMISRMENNNLHLGEEEVDVSELVDMTCGEMSDQAQQKNIRIEAHTQPGLIFRGDQTMLMRVYVNLIGNAVRYGRENGYVKISVTKSGREPGIFISRIEDNGIGIARENLGKIWNRFYQEDSSRSSGSGLGLFMVKWIVEYYGGTILAESTPGIGSTFTFSLPQTSRPSSDCSS